MTKKRVFFWENDEQHARMLTRLRYDKLKQGDFFRSLIRFYVDNDVLMAHIIERVKKEHSTMGKAKSKAALENIKKGEDMKRKLNLSEDEKNFIYDLIEEDFEE